MKKGFFHRENKDLLSMEGPQRFKKKIPQFQENLQESKFYDSTIFKVKKVGHILVLATHCDWFAHYFLKKD